MAIINLSTISSRISQTGWPLSIGLIILSLFFYLLNVYGFSYIYHSIRFKNNLGSYKKVAGRITSASLTICRISDKYSNPNRYRRRVNYTFAVEGKEYFGITEFEDDNIKSAIEKIRKYIPDQKVLLKINPCDKFKIDLSDLGEYDLFLRDMPFDFKPKLANAPIAVFYERRNPVNHCVLLDLSPSAIMLRIFFLLVFSVLGSLCLSVILFPLPMSFANLGVAMLLYLSAVVPAPLIGSPFIQKKENVLQANGLDKAQAVIYDIIVDQNNSEIYLKEQLADQKAKYQNSIEVK